MLPGKKKICERETGKTATPFQVCWCYWEKELGAFWWGKFRSSVKMFYTVLSVGMKENLYWLNETPWSLQCGLMGFSGFSMTAQIWTVVERPSCLPKECSELPLLCCFIECCNMKSKNCILLQTLSRFSGPQITLPSMAVQILPKKSRQMLWAASELPAPCTMYLCPEIFHIPFTRKEHTGKCYPFASIYKVCIKLSGNPVFRGFTEIDFTMWQTVPEQGSKQGMYV